MKHRRLLFSALIGAIASARPMTPMASIVAARLMGYRTPGRLVLLDRPLCRFGALAMGGGELFGDKMKTAPDRTVFLGLLARMLSAGIAGAALVPRGREPACAVTAVAIAIPLSYFTLGRPQQNRQVLLLPTLAVGGWNGGLPGFISGVEAGEFFLAG